MIKRTKQQDRKIQTFEKIILEKNQSINLISRKNPKKQWSFLLKQGLLSAELLSPVLNSSSEDVLDIGSGNGFPGLLFALLFPQRNFYLCESRRKKAEFLKNIQYELALTNVQILCQPAEELDPVFALILSQASLPLEKMIKLLQKILPSQGCAFLWHSEKGNQVKSLPSSLQLELFKSYRMQKQTKFLLKIQKRP